MSEKSRKLRPTESAELLRRWLTEVGIVNQSVIDFMLELRKICSWNTHTDMHDQLVSFHEIHRSKSDRCDISVPREIPFSSVHILLDAFGKIALEIRANLVTQLQGHQVLQVFTRVVANIQSLFQNPPPPLGTPQVITNAGGASIDLPSVSFGPSQFTAGVSFENMTIDVAPPVGASFPVNEHGIVMAAGSVGDLHDVIPPGILHAPYPSLPHASPADSSPSLNDVSHQTSVITATGQEISQLFGAAFGIEGNIEDHYIEAVAHMEALMKNPSCIDRMRAVYAGTQNIGADTLDDFRQCHQVMPDDFGPAVTALRQQSSAFAHHLFEELLTCFPPVGRSESQRVFDSQDEHHLRSFLRFLAFLALEFDALKGRSLGNVALQELPRLNIECIVISLLQSAFLTYIQRRFPWATEFIPWHEFDWIPLREEDIAIKKIDTLLRTDIEQSVVAAHLHPCARALTSAQQSFAGFRMLHDFGNCEKSRQPKPRRHIAIEHARMPDMHFIREDANVHEGTLMCINKACTSSEFGLLHDLRRVMYREDQTVVVWLTLNGEACHTPYNYIPLHAILPETASARFMADHMAGYCDEDILILQHQLHVACEQDDLFKALPQYLRDQGDALVLHAMGGIPLPGLSEKTAYMRHWVVPASRVQELGISATAMGMPFKDFFAELGQEAQSGIDRDELLAIGPFFSINLPEGDLVTITAALSDVDLLRTTLQEEEENEQNKDRVRHALDNVYPGNKTTFNLHEVTQILAEAGIEFLKRGASGSHQHVRGPRGRVNLKKEETDRGILVEKIAAVGNLDAFDEWALQKKP